MLDRLSKALDPVGRVQEYTYDPVGNVTEITKNGGRAYTYTYDNVGNLTSAKNPMNQVQNFTYDSMNRLTSETDLAGKATSYTYDLNGQLTSVTDKNGGVSSYTYDANGNVTSITDPESRKISYTYDLLDRITNVTEGETQTAQYEYDSVGNLTKYIDGNNKATTYTYNQLGEMTSITDPLGKVKEFSYNVNAMLETVTNPDDSTVNYDYDVLDELIGKSYDNEEDPQALYGYDLDGNRISMDDVAGTTGYEYDEVGRITAVNLSNGKKILYSYDDYGNISKLTYPDNTTVQYTYNELDQLTQIKDRQGKITKYDRDVNGNITKVTRPNNTYSTIEYDDMGNVIKVVNMGKNPYYGTVEELSAFAYIYDKSGFITGEVAKTGKRIETSQYEYDERAQLVKVSQTVTENNKFVEETEMVYTYDGAGNRLSAVKTSGNKALCNIQYTYNDNNQVTDIEGNCDDENKLTHIVLTYDENGNLKNTTCNDTEKVRDYTYDNENRLKAVKDNGTLLMAALYDGNGDRIFRLDYRKNADYVSNKAGTAENVYYPTSSVKNSYDTDVILNEMLIPNGVTQNTAINYELTGYINDINTEYTQTLMEFGANGNTTNIYEYGDGRNSATINGTKGYYLYDGRGSVAGLTGSNSGSMITYRYDAYGNTTKSNNTLNNPYQYNAEYTDSSTGLQYLRARYYDSSQGRFTTKDSVYGLIQLPITFNPYTYVCNNPLNLIDPSGEFFEEIFGGVAGVAKGTYGAGKALFTGGSVKQGWKSGFDSGYIAGSTVGQKWDNKVITFFGGTPRITRPQAESSSKSINQNQKERQEIDNELSRYLSGEQLTTANQRRIAEILVRRKELCESLEHLNKTVSEYNSRHLKYPIDNLYSDISLSFSRDEERMYDLNMQSQVKNLLSSNQYSETTWNNSSLEERRNILTNLLSDVSSILGVNVNPNIQFDQFNSIYRLGEYHHSDKTIHLNATVLERYNSYELLNTVVHETRHAYQHAAIDNPNLYVVSNETISQWKDNIKDYKEPIEGYNPYYEQPIEWDANGFMGRLDRDNHNPQYAGSW